MQSISENDFECFANTGVNTPGTILPKLEPQFVAHVKAGDRI
jgi:hypothetical protein